MWPTIQQCGHLKSKTYSQFSYGLRLVIVVGDIMGHGALVSFDWLVGSACPVSGWLVASCYLEMG